MNERANDPVEHRPSPGAGQIFLGTGSEPPNDPTPEQLANVYRLHDPTFEEMALDPLLDELLDRVREILDVDTVAILLLDESEKELVARAAKGLEEEVERGVRIPVKGGFAGRIAAERLPIFIPEVRQADVLNPILREKGLRSLLGVPMIVEGELLGVLHVGALEPRTFTNDDATVLQLAAARAAPAIERARLYDALEREHRAAVMLQRSLLPERLPERVGVPVAARYFPARDEVGGDWYDVVELGRGHLGIAIGDVAGHGVRAATLMGQLRVGLRAYALDGYGPGEVIERLDRLLQATHGRGMATATYGSFDPETGMLRFASAGHPPPIVCGPDRDSTFVEMSVGAPLGALRYSSYGENELTLEYGDIFLLYTDGLIEQRGTSLDAGLERLLEATQDARSPSQVCRQIVSRLIVREESEDDIAFVTLQRALVDDELLLRLPAEPSFLTQVRQALRPWLELRGVKGDDADQIVLACGEACANAVEHAYSPGPAFFEVEGHVEEGEAILAVRDAGRWRAPRGENRGRGLAIMESLMDSVEVRTTPRGTEVVLRRSLDK